MKHVRFLPNLRQPLSSLLCSTLLGAISAASSAVDANPLTRFAPDAQTLLQADTRSDDWLLPAKSYFGNRYSTLSQITPANVTTLGLVWRTRISDDGEQETAPLVSNGTIYVSTPHDNVLALDARTGKLKWQFAYNPTIILFAANRGVGIGDGKIFVATQDCQIIALNAETGKQLWSVPGCQDDSNSFFSMASYVYKGSVIVGTGGGDNGNRGHVTAFSTTDGKKQWDWETIKRETWPGTSWVHGGGDVWTGVAINPKTDTLFVAPGNPGPDMVATGRIGEDLYTNSIVALDISGKTPKVKWHYQLIKNDTHDSDPAMIPVLFSGTVKGHSRDLVAVGDKAGNFLILDQGNGELIHRMAVSEQKALDSPPTLQGTLSCPNHGGGIEWLGGAYDPNSNLFVIDSTNECGLFKLTTEHPEYVPGQAYEGGGLPQRRNASGLVSAVDIDTGEVKWKKELPFPAQGGALITATGLVFTTDLAGTVYALDVATGRELWSAETGSSITAPLSTFMLDGDQYLATVVGQPGNQQTPNLPAAVGSYVVAFRLGATQPVVNGADGQTPLAAIPFTGAATKIVGTGSAPYTSEQVAHGKTVYASQCAMCHGDKLQGVSAPALTGAPFAKSHLNASQIRSVVATQMPMTAPASLSADDYASIMAYMLAYDCVPPTDGGKVPFPTKDDSTLTKVTVGAKTCPPEAH